MDAKTELIIRLMKEALRKIIDGQLDDLCEASLVAETTLFAVREIENLKDE